MLCHRCGQRQRALPALGVSAIEALTIDENGTRPTLRAPRLPDGEALHEFLGLIGAGRLESLRFILTKPSIPHPKCS
jgi:hypothetical protein